MPITAMDGGAWIVVHSCDTYRGVFFMDLNDIEERKLTSLYWTAG